MRSLFLSLALLPALAAAQEKNYTAAQLIGAVKAAKPAGCVYARLRMEHRDAGGKQTVLQAQLKRRPLPEGSETLYQLLFPKERKGEALLLRVKGGGFSGATYAPGQGVHPLKAGDRTAGVFGTALTIDDAIADFLDWPQQQIVGREKEGAVPCYVVESRAPKSVSSPVTRVKSWIDETRLTEMKIELFKGGAQPVRSVITHKVMRGSSGWYAPVSFTVTDHATGASTKVEGVRSDNGISFTDADFTETAMQTIASPSGGK
ncbi:MAG: outer membrane lipoprotein-sorting protein [Verrucomicrobiaceae bacterium]|nr:outer membrane lipoprotein-sorting protein [Verrucomicrobiaceae bacterium]